MNISFDIKNNFYFSGMNRIIIFLFAVLFSVPVFAAEKETKVLIKTTMGKITVKLYNDTPLHRDNFIKLVQENKYDSIMFHRVIKLFMIQAGEKYPPVDSTRFTSSMGAAKDSLDTKPPKFIKRMIRKLGFKSEKKESQQTSYWIDPNYKAPDYKIPPEILFPKYFHKRGQLCAAREENSVNPARESSAMQFYIVTGKHYTENELNKMERERNITFTPEQREAFMFSGGVPRLDGEYTIFGEVTKGFKTMLKIELTNVDHFDRPLKDIRIKKTIILKK